MWLKSTAPVTVVLRKDNCQLLWPELKSSDGRSWTFHIWLRFWKCASYVCGRKQQPLEIFTKSVLNSMQNSIVSSCYLPLRHPSFVVCFLATQATQLCVGGSVWTTRERSLPSELWNLHLRDMFSGRLLQFAGGYPNREHHMLLGTQTRIPSLTWKCKNERTL